MDCLNCGKEFTRSDNYCPSCGQDTSTKRMNTKHAVHQFFHAFTHTDKGFFYLVPKLITKPGIISREYNEGKRKAYFSPFAFVLLIVAVSTILVANYNILTPPGSVIQRPQAIVSNFINKHFNLVVFFSIPAIAFYTSRLFKIRINFAESLVIVSYTTGERSIFFSVIIIPLVLMFKSHHYLIVNSYVVLFMLYYSWACCQYFSDYRVKTFIKAALSFILAQLTVAIIIGVVISCVIFLSK